jgi:HSP20 family molecular chaperone IbpA
MTTTQTETKVAPTNGNGNGNGHAAPQQPAAIPRYTVTEAKDGFQVSVFLPGIDKSAVETTVEHNRLTVRARQTWKAPETWSVVHRETRQPNYQLVLELDPSIDQSSVSADLSNGVLKLKLSKAKALQPRRIEILN